MRKHFAVMPETAMYHSRWRTACGRLLDAEYLADGPSDVDCCICTDHAQKAIMEFCNMKINGMTIISDGGHELLVKSEYSKFIHSAEIVLYEHPERPGVLFLVRASRKNFITSGDVTLYLVPYADILMVLDASTD